MHACCYRVVGALIWQGDRLLMFERNTPPKGIACPAGHMDTALSPYAAMCKEVYEEVGLTVTSAKLLLHPIHLLPPCRRQQAAQENYGHLWFVYQAEVEDYEVKHSEREAKNPQWYTVEEIRELARAGRLEADWVSIFTKLFLL